MKHLAAYLLLGLAGNTSPSDSDIKGVLESVGIDADEDRLEKLLSELKGKDINEVCENRVVRDTQCTNIRSSWLLKVQRNSHLYHQAVLAAVARLPVQEARPLQVVQQLQPRRRSQRRRKRRKRSRTRIWASVYSTRDLRSSWFEQVENGTPRLLARRIQNYKAKVTISISAALQAYFYAQIWIEL